MQGSVDDLRVFLLGIGFEAIYPSLVRSLLHELCHFGQRLFAVAEDGECGLHVLAELRGVNLKVNDLGLLGVCLQVARHTVVEAHADSYEQVALVGHDVRRQIAVHTEHSHVERMVGRCGGKAEQSGGKGNLSLLAKRYQLLVRTGQLYALTDEHKGLDALVYHAGSFRDGSFFGLRIGVVAADEVDRLRSILYHGRLCILRKVEHHGTGPAALGNEEGTCHGPRDVFGTTYLVVPLRDGLRHAHDVNLLEGIGAQHGSAHLSADDNHRRGVNHGIGHARNGVHGPRTARHDGTAHLAADAGIALSGMYGSLFVAYQNVVQRLLVVVECIVGRHDGAPGVTEKHIHTLVLKATHQHLGTCDFFVHYRNVILLRCKGTTYNSKFKINKFKITF